MIAASQPLSATAVKPPAAAPAGDPALLTAARALEARFLTEMLGHAGFGEARTAFGGGIGEEQFASFLREEQARAMAEAGGIGLAQSIFTAVSLRTSDDV